MRLATLAVHLGFLFTSFALGVLSGRNEPAPAPLPPERLPVAGSAHEAIPSVSEAEPIVAAHLPDRSSRRKSGAAATREPPTWAQVASRAQGWSVSVRADQNYGAGVILDPAGLVLTNLHVVKDARAISVTPFGADVTPVELLDSDLELDLALLQMPEPVLNAATIGSSRGVGVGDEVMAVGSPRKMYFSVSRGMVSFPNRFLDGVEYIQTDLPINVGNSGGPLVDREGRVVGIVSFILRDSQGISFALPIDRAVTRFAKHLFSDASRGRATVREGAVREGAVREAAPRDADASERTESRAAAAAAREAAPRDSAAHEALR